jgi:hypothetical protein
MLEYFTVDVILFGVGLDRSALFSFHCLMMCIFFLLQAPCECVALPALGEAVLLSRFLQFRDSVMVFKMLMMYSLLAAVALLLIRARGHVDSPCSPGLFLILLIFCAFLWFMFTWVP